MIVCFLSLVLTSIIHGVKLIRTSARGEHDVAEPTCDTTIVHGGHIGPCQGPENSYTSDTHEAFLTYM